VSVRSSWNSQFLPLQNKSQVWEIHVVGLLSDPYNKITEIKYDMIILEGLGAWDAHEEGRLVYKYGGQPVGSFFQPNLQLLSPTTAHALFMDVTHDNESVISVSHFYLPLSTFTV